MSDSIPDISKLSLEEIIRSDLECSVCLNLPRGDFQMLQCTNGHLICNGCADKNRAARGGRSGTPTCPTCRVPCREHIRSLLAEKILVHLARDCRFGCGVRMKEEGGGLEGHERECPSRPSFACFLCGERATSASFREHLGAGHPEVVKLSDQPALGDRWFRFPLQEPTQSHPFTVYQTRLGGEDFLFCLSARSETWRLHPVHLGEDEDSAGNFVASIAYRQRQTIRGSKFRVAMDFPVASVTEFHLAKPSKLPGLVLKVPEMNWSKTALRFQCIVYEKKDIRLTPDPEDDEDYIPSSDQEAEGEGAVEDGGQDGVEPEEEGGEEDSEDNWELLLLAAVGSHPC